MFCSHCGKEIRDDASFCPECGAPVYRKEDEQKAAEDLEKSSAVFEENGKSAAFGPDGTISDSGQTSASDSKQSSAGGGYFYSPQPNPYGGAYNGGSRQNAYGEQQRKSSKSKIAAGLLGIFLGSIGVHNFYLGRTGRGIAQIVATICTCGIAGIWGFIEGILCLCGNYTDADGLPLSD